MLPTHALISLGIGLAWVSQDDIRTRIPALYALRHIWPIQATGLLRVCIGGLVLLAMLTRRRAVAAVMLLAGAATYLLLAVAIAASVAHHPASYSAPMWPLYIAAAHLATALSLASDEYTDTEGANRQRTP
jgi:hypothetical protein